MCQWDTQSTRSKIYDILKSHDQRIGMTVKDGQYNKQDDASQWNESVRHARQNLIGPMRLA